MCIRDSSYDMAKEGYVNLLAIQKRHAADPGDGKAMVRARRAFLQAGYYAPFQKALAELCLEYAPECGETHLLDAGCGEGSYDRVVYDAFAAQGLSLIHISSNRPSALHAPIMPIRPALWLRS